MTATVFCALLNDADGNEFEADVVLVSEYDKVLRAALAANAIAGERDRAWKKLDSLQQAYLNLDRRAEHWKTESMAREDAIIRLRTEVSALRSRLKDLGWNDGRLGEA